MKKIKLTHGQFALVDDKDFNELNKHKWSAYYNKNINKYYVVRGKKINGKQTAIRMPRVIMNVPKGKQVYYINHDTLDNRKENLCIRTNKRPTICIDGQQRRISRYVMEKHLKRKLRSDELVHHKDGNPRNNELSNLELVSRGAHMKMHKIGEKTRLKKIYNFDVEKVVKLYELHKSCTKVGSILGCHYKTVSRILIPYYKVDNLRKLAKRNGWKYSWRNEKNGSSTKAGRHINYTSR